MSNIKIEVQGDVALRPSALPAGAVKIAKRPLALGEVSGHAHVIQSDVDSGFDLFEFEGKTFVSTGNDGASLHHIKIETGSIADHQPIVLAPNTVYEVILQNEYNPEAQAFERVLD